MRAAFYTLGCKVNQYETQAMKEQFAAAGFEIVPPDAEAEVYILNSCTVTSAGDKKTRRLLRGFRRRNPGAKLVLTGCLPQTRPEIAEELPEADIVTGTAGRSGLLELVRRSLQSGERIVQVPPHVKGEAFERLPVQGGADKTRAFLKIQDGCTQFCAYCIIPFARGPLRSKPLDELEEDLTALALRGYREVVLVGINLSLYGRERGERLPDAVRLACRIPGIERVRLGSVEPELLTLEDIDAMARCEKLCPQFHLALQSGCDATLARMNRHYTTAQYRAIAERFREKFPGAAITTDVIVGFPGESEEEFAQTLAFVESLGLARTHVFPYSVRQGTAAAGMDGQVAPAVKEARVHRLTEVAERSRMAFYQAQVGRVEEVLIERKTQPDTIHGYTRNYTPVTIPCTENRRGELLQARITAAAPEGCLGELVATAP